MKTNNYDIKSERPPLDGSNNSPYNYGYHTIKVQLLEDAINSDSITNYETHKTYYDEVIDLVIKGKLPVTYVIQPNICSNKWNLHMGILTKRINASVIINDYMIKLTKFLSTRH